jgi:hypothetical protein
MPISNNVLSFAYRDCGKLRGTSAKISAVETGLKLMRNIERQIRSDRNKHCSDTIEELRE